MSVVAPNNRLRLCLLVEKISLNYLSVLQHDFHPPCLQNWLDVRANCPTCRSTVSADGAAQAAPADPVIEAASQRMRSRIIIRRTDPVGSGAGSAPRQPPAAAIADRLRKLAI